MKPRRTTAAEFRRFKAEATRLIEKLGLKGWRVTFRHEYLGDIYGDMHADCLARSALIRFNSVRVGDPESTPECTARHEVLELLMARMNWMATCRFGINDGDIIEETHAVIRALENVV